MDRLRTECPWDQQQTHESLVRYLIEEAYETVEAIEIGDSQHLQEELGDLLLQIMFHARIASDDPAEPFDIDDVAGAIVAKLIRRHPHVFADVEVGDAAEVEADWESIKTQEKARRSSMDGLPPGLPALSLAANVVGRAKTGLSVPTPADTVYTAETLGEVLFALAAAAQAAGIDPEQALRHRVRREIAEVRAAEQRALQVDAAPSG
ncbi:MAG: MazG family protein [Nocardioidaceae bacterium]